jgi:hypothetical protein
MDLKHITSLFEEANKLGAYHQPGVLLLNQHSTPHSKSVVIVAVACQQWPSQVKRTCAIFALLSLFYTNQSYFE